MSAISPTTATPGRVLTPLSKSLRRCLAVVLGLLAVLAANSLYLVAVRVMSEMTGKSWQNFFYLQMFLLHVILGLVLVVPTTIFVIGHARRTYRRRNRRAVMAGYALATAVAAVMGSGLLLTRVEGLIEINRPALRGALFWVHVVAPLAVVWLYVLHRLAGRRIGWRLGVRWAVVTLVAIGMTIAWHHHDPRKWNVVGPASGETYFYPSLSRTSSGNFIPAGTLDKSEYCLECHREAHRGWTHSAHRLSSFNNPAYLFSVSQTRQKLMRRDGSVKASRFCAGCHDPVPFFSGAFDDPKFDDPEYDLASDSLAQAGITCTSCHAISHINDVRGNGSYTIDEPIHYPFTDSDNGWLRWVSRQLVKAKPQFHKETFLKPLHRTAEFCGTCHKVHLPPELNDYKWLRGQNHYDSFLLSGVSGHGVSSFYYPPVAQANCNGCHMPPREVEHSSSEPNFAARTREGSDELTTLDHQFPSANTAIAWLLRDRLPDADGAIEAHREFLDGSLRVDLFGIRDGGRIDGELTAPLDPTEARLRGGESYLLETVVRTLTLGHLFTQGTVDSNEIWLDMTVRLNGDVIGRSGGMRDTDGAVDPWSHFINAFVIDRNGYRIDRRNAEDIFVTLYNNQIPPGAAATVHHRFELPADAEGELEIEAHVRYRKFDTEYMRLVHEELGLAEPGRYVNDLPITTLASDRITLKVGDEAALADGDASVVEAGPVGDVGQRIASEQDEGTSPPIWQRWNDFGIGLLLAGQYRQAERAFGEVERLGEPDGALNRARVYLAEGRVSGDAQQALTRARGAESSDGRRAPEWTLLWLAGRVNRQNADYETAIRCFEQILEGGFEQARGRGFDFRRDYRLLGELADTYVQYASTLRGGDADAERERLLRQGEATYQKALVQDPENAAAHYGLSKIYKRTGDDAKADRHAELHGKYKVDDNARDFAVSEARRRYPAADHAAERVVVYDLQRDGAYRFSGDEADSQ